MKAVVVYQSLWGNTAAIARAIAEGIGGDTRVLSTAEATGEAIADADLIVAGSPLMGFTLPSDKMVESVRDNPGNPPEPPDLSHPSMRTWLDSLPKGKGHSAAFETRIWWSPGSAAKKISRGLEAAGYAPIAKHARFVVAGRCGPLREGEIEKARQWGAELAGAVR